MPKNTPLFKKSERHRRIHMMRKTGLMFLVMMLALSTQVIADTGLVKFRTLTKNSAVSQAKKILNKLEKESSARFLYLYFKSGSIAGTSGYLFVDVDPEKVSPDLRKSMILFDQIQIQVTLFSQQWHSTDLRGKLSHSNSFSFSSGEKAFEFLEKWKLLTSEFPVSKWASDPAHKNMVKPKYFQYSREYLVEFVTKKGDLEETIFEDTVFSDSRFCE
ncbi:hypothetical protein KBA41_04060 [Candidatus Ozemobacteraceae bacterium]|nr:hypothetical protein [Candidatus Ozemobacteraceae bacterium]